MKLKDKLRVYWSKSERDIESFYPLGQGTVCDTSYLLHVFDKEFRKQMSERGYDIKTLKFSIEPIQGDSKFASQRNEK